MYLHIILVLEKRTFDLLQKGFWERRIQGAGIKMVSMPASYRERTWAREWGLSPSVAAEVFGAMASIRNLIAQRCHNRFQ